MSEKLPPGTLCAVCSDLATGKHYSVASCNGCKTFFRRALVNKREFVCQGNKDCPVNKGVRCSCRYCRLQKCISVGMDKNSIQNDRDRIGYTKRKRRFEDGLEIDNETCRDISSRSPTRDSNSPDVSIDQKFDLSGIDPTADRLTTLENNFSLLLSRCSDLQTYETLEEALNGPSRFLQPINYDWSDPIVHSLKQDDKMPFWRQRLITLYIDWAKTFPSFRSLPYSDKVAMVTNHASSFMIMSEAFRTPEHIRIDVVKTRPELSGIVNSESDSSRVSSEEYRNMPEGQCDDFFDDFSNEAGIQKSINNGIIFGNGSCKKEQGKLVLNAREIKMEPIDTPNLQQEMIRLPTEYGSLPLTYASWIPKDYGHPTAGHEGKPDMHNFFDARVFCEMGRPASCSYSERSLKNTTLVVPREHTQTLPKTSLSGITPVLAMMIDLVMKPFRQLNFSTTEFAILQAIMFFDPDTEGLDSASQRNVVAEQKRLLSVLFRHLQKAYSPSAASDRYSSILLRIPTIRRAAAKKNESLQVMDMLKLHEMNSLVKETSLGPQRASMHSALRINKNI